MSTEWEEAKTIGFVAAWELEHHHVREYHNRLAISRYDNAVMSWEELQEVKNRIWGKLEFAVEVYPAQSYVVNAWNTRHLWRFAEGALEHAVRHACDHKEFVVARREENARRERSTHQDC